jgi:hypothetical protein
MVSPRMSADFGLSGRILKSNFFALTNDIQFKPTGGKAHKIRVTGYLMWDDDHNGSTDIGSTIQKFHHPWRSTDWEIHPVTKIEDLGQK